MIITIRVFEDPDQLTDDERDDLVQAVEDALTDFQSDNNLDFRYEVDEGLD